MNGTPPKTTYTYPFRSNSGKQEQITIVDPDPWTIGDEELAELLTTDTSHSTSSTSTISFSYSASSVISTTSPPSSSESALTSEKIGSTLTSPKMVDGFFIDPDFKWKERGDRTLFLLMKPYLAEIERPQTKEEYAVNSRYRSFQ
jgi:hypothetical protein